MCRTFAWSREATRLTGALPLPGSAEQIRISRTSISGIFGNTLRPCISQIKYMRYWRVQHVDDAKTAHNGAIGFQFQIGYVVYIIRSYP